MDVGVPKIRTKPNECCQPSKWTHHGLQWHVHLFRTYTCRFLPWVLSTLNINFRLGILHDTSKKYQKIPSSAGDAPFFHHPKGLIDLGFVFHLHHVNLPVHRRRCAELPAGRQRLAHPRSAERWAGAGRHRREELWQSRGHGQVLGMEVHGSSSLLQDFVSSKWLTQQFPGFLVINPSDCDFVTL